LAGEDCTTNLCVDIRNLCTNANIDEIHRVGANLTPEVCGSYLETVDVHFTPEQESQLSAIASRTGTNPEQLVRDTVARLLENEAHFIEAVRKGFASLDRGEYVTHEDVGRHLERLFPA
jgi:predicted transcriptional regulator